MQSQLRRIEKRARTREEIDQWQVEDSGFSARVLHCLEKAGVHTVGELREWNDKKLLSLRSFGSISLRNVHWFFNWTNRLENNTGELPNFRALLREFLNRQEVFVTEQRFGLTDPLFRPQMRRRTLQAIAEMRGKITRERVRQVEETAIAKLRSRLCRAVSVPQEIYWASRIQARGYAVTSAELVEWADDPMLGGYQPWGVLLLLSEALTRIHFRYDYFSAVPRQSLDQVEKQILQLLHEARKPLPFEEILATVSGQLGFPDGQRRRLVTVLLDHHPEICGTVDRRYFLPAVGAPFVVADILRSRSEPLHFRELTRLYNERMQPHSHKGTGYILRVLRQMGGAQRVSPAVYQFKTASRRLVL
jgi:hypothetical protein